MRFRGTLRHRAISRLSKSHEFGTSDMILYSMRLTDGIIMWVAKRRRYRGTRHHQSTTAAGRIGFNAIPITISRNMPTRSRHGGERLKNRKKMQKFAVGHKCPNYLVSGIRSTAIIWTATPKSRWSSKFAGRTRERTSSPPILAPSLSEFAFRRTKLSLSVPPAQKPPPPFCHSVPGKPIPFTSVFPNGQLTVRRKILCDFASLFQKNLLLYQEILMIINFTAKNNLYQVSKRLLWKRGKKVRYFTSINLYKR